MDLFSLGCLLSILFIALKLTHHVTWSWLWVLSPIWISLIIDVISSLFILSIVSSF